VETFLSLARAPNAREAGAASSRLSAVADEQVVRWRPEAEARGLTLECVTEAADDAHYQGPLLRAVMSNLLRNAVHYTDHGFVRLALRHHGFSVIDSGAGIPEDQRSRVFQPFIRGDASRGDGIGIGLSLVQRICHRKGWTITLDEHAGGCCEFRVDFESP
jgi:signal transduction histidine kinase